MTDADAVAARLAAGHDGILTTSLLLDGGLSQRRIDRLSLAGVLTRLDRGVYRHAAVPPTRRSQIRAAVLVGGPNAVASHRSAAALLGLQEVPRFRPEILTRDVHVPRQPWLRAHRTTQLDPADVCTVDGIPTTTVPLTLLHLGSVLDAPRVVEVAQLSLIRGQVTAEALLSVLERVGRRGRGGTATLREVVRQSIPEVGAASLLEQRLAELVREAGLPDPVRQYELRCDDGRTVRLDQAWPEWQLAIEADGHRWHATRKQLEKDLARARSIQSSGWAHYRYGWGDVHAHRDATVAELVNVLRRHATSVPERPPV